MTASETATTDTLDDRMVRWRHHLHRFPETGFEESRTSDLVARQLERKLREYNEDDVRATLHIFGRLQVLYRSLGPWTQTHKNREADSPRPCLQYLS